MKKEQRLRESKENYLIEALKHMANGLARTFGSRCEVVVHDLRNLDRSIVKIVNGHVTGRSAGGSVTDLGLKILSGNGKDDLRINYPTMSQDGRQLKSSTFMFRDGQGEYLAALCINIDVTDFMGLKTALEDMFKISDRHEEGEFIESFDEEILSTLNKSADKVISKTGKALPSMRKEDRVKVVHDLERQGYFLIKGAVKLLAEKLKVSKFSIYNYLEEVRKENQSSLISG